jgi:methionyl-tRNA formyltransferase
MPHADSAEDDSATLHDRLAQLGAELLAQTIPDYVAGKIQPVPQPAAGASYAAKIKKEDGRIDWNQPAREIWNRLRAFTPWPGAFTFLRSAEHQLGVNLPAPKSAESVLGAPKPQLLKIWKAEVVEASGRARPGEILSVDKTGMVVGCGGHALRILELQREGGRRLTAAEFLAGHPMEVGESFLV